MDEWISKRELLIECGITYGQLYRWKREGLIPEGWFVKRSVPTGQETFLPREQSIARVKLILGDKGRCSQTALRKALSPTRSTYKSTTLIRLPGVTKPLIQVAALTGAKDFNYMQALCSMIGAQIVAACAEKNCPLPDEQLRSMLKNLLTWAEKTDCFFGQCGQISVFQFPFGTGILFFDRVCGIDMPLGAKLIYTLHLDDIPELFNAPLRALDQ